VRLVVTRDRIASDPYTARAVAEIDPYAVLGVSRTASRGEIGRAYRALAKRHHPDVGSTTSPAMSRINEAWRILSDPDRRARWDRSHPVAVAAPHWAPGPGRAHVRRESTSWRPRSAPVPATPSVRDSGWLAVAVVLAIAVVAGGMLLLTGAVGGPARSTSTFEGEGLSFRHSSDWTVVAGEPGQPVQHRVIAHLVTFDADEDLLCTRFADACELVVPSGHASVVFTAWQSDRPEDQAAVMARGAYRDGRQTDGAIALWQLRPPGFPQRWVEARAVIVGFPVEQQRLIERLDAMLNTVEFADPG
jgi:hypothetical protein